MPDGVWHENGRVLIELGAEDARWLAYELSPLDGFTRDIIAACDEADEWIRIHADADKDAEQ